MIGSKEGRITMGCKGQEKIAGRGERMVRALRMFILPHSWAPAEYTLSDLGFGWLEAE